MSLLASTDSRLSVLLGRFRIERQNLHKPAGRLDLGSLFLEDLPGMFPVGKGIGAIA